MMESSSSTLNGKVQLWEELVIFPEQGRSSDQNAVELAKDVDDKCRSAHVRGEGLRMSKAQVSH